MNIPKFEECTPNPLCVGGCGKEVSRPWGKYFLGHKNRRGVCPTKNYPLPPRVSAYGMPYHRLKPQKTLRKEQIEFLRYMTELRLINLNLARQVKGLQPVTLWRKEEK